MFLNNDFIVGIELRCERPGSLTDFQTTKPMLATINGRVGWLRPKVEGCRIVTIDFPGGGFITASEGSIEKIGFCHDKSYCGRPLY